MEGWIAEGRVSRLMGVLVVGGYGNGVEGLADCIGGALSAS